ncbi:hypothetical protein LV779_38405 [Streptomyces thinghirensis]|nr:hypothetical protein [Streptomyces thinghirensis]
MTTHYEPDDPRGGRATPDGQDGAPPPAPPAPSPRPLPRRRHAEPRRPRLRGLWRGRPRGPPLGAPGLPRPAAGHRPALPLRPERLGLRQLLLLGRRAGGRPVLEGVLLRLARRRERHHRRQAPGRAVADGAGGADLRAELCGRSWSPRC